MVELLSGLKCVIMYIIRASKKLKFYNGQARQRSSVCHRGRLNFQEVYALCDIKMSALV